MKNENRTLPLSKGQKLNVFGWTSVAPCYGETGSGTLNDNYHIVDLLEGLSNAGFETNTELSDFYKAYQDTRPVIGMFEQDWTLPEPPADTYPSELISNAKSFSESAVIVLTRAGGEQTDLPRDLSMVNYTDNSENYKDFPSGTHYLEPSQSERDMIALVCENFDNVILVYNGANTMELGIAEEYEQIKSVIWCPVTGQNGFNALGEILSGEINPSGKTAANAVAGAKSRGVYAYIKHFALNDQETNRWEMICVWANEQAIRELYLKPFEFSVKEGGTTAVMSSYNYIGTQWAGACSSLLTDVLREEWGFEGIVLTDYFADFGYMDATRSIYNGGSSCLINRDVTTNYVTDTDNPTTVAHMRDAAHDVLYTAVNSRGLAEENLTTGPMIWQIILVTADVIIGVLLVLFELFIVKKGYQKRKTISVEAESMEKNAMG